LNVRGKRGNIVQTFPSVEYDFIPNELTVKTNDFMHIQWTGSNSNERDLAGQGRDQTDRSNFVMLDDLNKNIPSGKVAFYNNNNPLSNGVSFIGYVKGDDVTDNSNIYLQTPISPNGTEIINDMSLYLASSGYYKCEFKNRCDDSFENKTLLDVNLDNAPASLPGAIVRFQSSLATFYYMSSRNNQFSNRNQIGFIKTIATKFSFPNLPPPQK
jgi:hypothetical protein